MACISQWNKVLVFQFLSENFIIWMKFTDWPPRENLKKKSNSYFIPHLFIHLQNWLESESVTGQSCPTLATPWAVAHQVPLSMEFSRQEYWSGLPFPPPGDLPDPGMEPRFPACRQIPYHLSHQGSPMDCDLPGFSAHGIFQARILEWGAISYCRRSSWPRDQTWVSCVSCIGRQSLYHWVTWEALTHMN